MVSLVPLPTIATNQGVNESQVGGTATVYGQFTNDAQAHKVTVTWGDGSPNTVVNLIAGVFTFAVAVPAGTYTDDPNGPIQTIHRRDQREGGRSCQPGQLPDGWQPERRRQQRDSYRVALDA